MKRLRASCRLSLMADALMRLFCELKGRSDEAVAAAFARKGETQISLQAQAVGHALGLEEIGEGEAHDRAFGRREAVEEIAERACLGPFEQGVGIAVDLDQRSQIAAIVGEAGLGEQSPELIVAETENRMRVSAMAAETGLLDRLPQQGA